jgi:hypothetical protein
LELEAEAVVAAATLVIDASRELAHEVDAEAADRPIR